MLRQPILKPLCLVNKLRNPENVRIGSYREIAIAIESEAGDSLT